jgi:hypothetical protein
MTAGGLDETIRESVRRMGGSPKRRRPGFWEFPNRTFRRHVEPYDDGDQEALVDSRLSGRKMFFFVRIRVGIPEAGEKSGAGCGG